MIFVTIGTQAPFDRFIRSVDLIASKTNEKVVAQTYKGIYIPQHIEYVDFLPPNEFNRLFNEARLIVAHAGMGTIISALAKKKPIIIMPRLASLGEHRNDHQMATAMKMNELGYVYVAYDNRQLETLILDQNLKPLYELEENQSERLADSIKCFLKKQEPA